MNGADLRGWRKLQKLTQDSASIQLGVSRSAIIAYEKRASSPLPKTVELACLAIEANLADMETAREAGRYVDILKGTRNKSLMSIDIKANDHLIDKSTNLDTLNTKDVVSETKSRAVYNRKKLDET